MKRRHSQRKSAKDKNKFLKRIRMSLSLEDSFNKLEDSESSETDPDYMNEEI